MSNFSAPPPPTYAQASSRVRAAKIITDVLAPAHLVICLLLLVGWHSTPGNSGLGWGLIAALFCGVVPACFVHLAVRSGRVTDKHIRVRRQRLVPLAASVLSVTSGVVLLLATGAPVDVTALVVAMLTGLACTLAVTVRWQISVHNAVAGGSVMILVLVFGAPALPAVLLVPLVGWSRRVLKAHTVAQLLCGTALGAVSALVFILLR
ncbi:hypothetical protein [Streptomyces spiramenti]|uniref:Phosphoesterase PA-phosphatase n=1 Tax=Streptomyces spiramenti TaxID=2720606 RepID=A0ABX1AFR7_9ACTN|nr:hypothetical protein [Streptomyces spiramenti]NJP64801.1 hypothetical protein [Streptomyces spiramenti]